MTGKKGMQPTIRSSAVEYLTFIAATGEGGVDAVYADENIWLSQKMLAELYQVKVPTVNYHLKKVFEDSELQEEAVIRDFLMTADDGKNYTTKHYNIAAIIAVGYKVNSERAQVLPENHRHLRHLHRLRHHRRCHQTLFCYGAEQTALGYPWADRSRAGTQPCRCW